MRLMPASIALATLSIAACVTINVYFPAAAAEKAADRIIDDVWKLPKDSAPAASPVSALPVQWLLTVADFILPTAQAQQPNIDISSPEVKRVMSSIETRFGSLKPLLDSGAVGLSGDGLVTLRDATAVPLSQRNAAKSLVSDENNDRKALYREIAVANGQPQWEGQIRSVFAQRWVAKASAGWWYEDSSGWKQK